MTDEQMQDLVKKCGLDWQRGYMPLSNDDPTNRYALLIEVVEAAILRKLAGKPERKAQDDGGYDLVAAWDRSGLVYPDDMVDPVFQAGWDAARSTT